MTKDICIQDEQGHVLGYYHFPVSPHAGMTLSLRQVENGKEHYLDVEIKEVQCFGDHRLDVKVVVDYID
jgi:hypothetical protein